MVRATWKLSTVKRSTTLALAALGRPLSKKDTAAVTAEARRLLGFAAPEDPGALVTLA